MRNTDRSSLAPSLIVYRVEPGCFRSPRVSILTDTLYPLTDPLHAMNASPSNRTDGRGQSSPIGVVLLLGLIIAAATSVAVFGGTVLQDSQDRSEVGQAEQAMTQFDARAAQVALGDSDSQTVQLGGSSGTYSVQEDVGRVRLLHGNWNGSDCADCEADYGGFDNTSGDGNTTVL